MRIALAPAGALLLVRCLAVCAATLPAPTPVWTPIGPAGAGAPPMTWCAGSSAVAYVATAWTGLFRTVDAAAHWEPVGSGLPSPYVSAVQSASLDCSRIYVATTRDNCELDPGCSGGRVAFSSDGGGSWEEASAGLPGTTITAFLLAPSDPSTLYAVGGAGVFRTRVGSTSWSAVWLPGSGPVTSLAVDPRDGSILYASLGVGGIYKSIDAGVSWKSAEQFPSSDGARNLLFDPVETGTLYALSRFGSSELWRTLDGARTWQKAPHPDDRCGVGFMTASDAGALYLGGLCDVPSFLASEDHGVHWRKLGGVAAALGDVSEPALAVAPQGSTMLALGAGIARSTDGGVHWSAASAGLPGQAVDQVSVSSDGTLFAGRYGTHRLARRGSRWEAVDAGSIMAIDPEQPDTLYSAATNPGPFPFPYGKSTDGGRTWSPFSFPNQNGFSTLVIDPTSPKRLYSVGFAVYRDDRPPYLFKSLDGGITWIGLWNNDGFETMLVDPQHPTVLYGTGGDDLIERSDDGGNSWTRADAGISDFDLQALAADPTHSGALYAATDHGLFGTTDGGASWRLLSMVLAGSTTNQLIVDPRNASRLYAAELAGDGTPEPGGNDGQGAFGSFDGGLTWAPVGQALPSAMFNGSLALDRGYPETLYAATDVGVFRLNVEP